jgi:hypothetical protein
LSSWRSAWNSPTHTSLRVPSSEKHPEMTMLLRRRFHHESLYIPGSIVVLAPVSQMTGIGCEERGRVGFGYRPCGLRSSSVTV